MFNLDLFRLFYDVIAYFVALRGLLDEVLYKLGFTRSINTDRDLPANLQGHVAIVTGGTRGLGLTVVRSLISKGCMVFVASSQAGDKYADLKFKIYDGLPLRHPETKVERGTVTLHNLDLSSLESVKSFIDAFKSTRLNLNYLICNAGIMFAPRQLTVDGFESHLAINYFGHALLILELLPLLKKTADKSKTNSRIISVSSSTHTMTRFRFEDLMGEINYSSSQAYAQSKLAQVMFSAKLSDMIRETLGWKNVQVFSLHPGIVLSELYEHVKLIKYFPFLIPLIKLVTRNIVQGAETTLYATLSPELDDISGVYLENCAPKEPSKRARSEDDQCRLWDMTLQILSPWLSSNFVFDNNNNNNCSSAGNLTYNTRSKKLK